MISTAEASKLILDTATKFTEELVPLGKCTGRVLRETVVADRAFPPFDRVMRDGIAISYHAIEKGIRNFPILSTQYAGMPPHELSDLDAAIEIMTGAVIPEKADTVIQYEDLDIKEGIAHLRDVPVKKGQHVHLSGNDQPKGEILLEPGRLISSPAIAVASTVGRSELRVSTIPGVAVISTGDELVPIEELPLPHQIRQSNGMMIASALKGTGVEAKIVHLEDRPEIILEELGKLLDSMDLLIVSGGVSKGKADYIPEALDQLGVKKLFHKVAQRPGKPFWFGQKGKKVVFALPGNPVSSFVGTYRYVIPWIEKSMGMKERIPQFARLEEDFSFKPPLSFYLQVQLSTDPSGILWAKPVPGKGSGDLANLLHADAIMELPAQKEFFSKGEAFPFLRIK